MIDQRNEENKKEKENEKKKDEGVGGSKKKRRKNKEEDKNEINNNFEIEEEQNDNFNELLRRFTVYREITEDLQRDEGSSSNKNVNKINSVDKNNILRNSLDFQNNIKLSHKNL